MGKSKSARTYRFADFRAEAASKATRAPKKIEVPPFIISDVEPPIVITAPDTVERQLVIAECLDEHGAFEAAKAVPLLRALCGDQFPRVWSMVKRDTDPNTLIAMIQALFGHFMDELADVKEAAGLPGGSEASSS